MFKSLFIFIITIYQRTLSPDHGLFRGRYPYGFCRKYPSCSEYTKQSITQFGVSRGFGKGVIRIFKCNPWTQPAIDEVRAIR